eukprot:gene9190-biopygen1650
MPVSFLDSLLYWDGSAWTDVQIKAACTTGAPFTHHGKCATTVNSKWRFVYSSVKYAAHANSDGCTACQMLFQPVERAGCKLNPGNPLILVVNYQPASGGWGGDYPPRERQTQPCACCPDTKLSDTCTVTIYLPGGNDRQWPTNGFTRLAGPKMGNARDQPVPTQTQFSAYEDG